MANFKDSPIFSIHDDYYTPFTAWKQIKPFLIKKGFKVINEPFLLNSNEQSKRHLEALGFKVLGNKKVDFFNKDTYEEDQKNLNYCCSVSNPPFSKVKSFKERENNLKYKCIKGLMETKKPFIFLLNSTNIFSKWFKEIMENEDIKFILPTKKIQYDKYEKGGKIKIEKQNEFFKRIKEEKNYKYLKDLNEEEKAIYDTLPKKGGCSFNSIYITFKVLDKNEWI